MNKIAEFLQSPIVSMITFIVTTFTLIGMIYGMVCGWKRIRDEILLKKITIPVYVYLIVLFLIALAFMFWPTIEDRPKQLRTIEGESFGIQRIYLDGKRFMNCKFNGTELVFKAEGGFQLVNNDLKDVKLTLGGSAGSVLVFLKALYKEPGFRPYIDNTFEMIKSANELERATTPSGVAND